MVADVLITQIYFTAVQILLFFFVVSALFGSVFISVLLQTAKNIGLTAYIGDMIVGIVVLELAPFITTLLVALRTGSAINAEIAVMKVNRELDALEAYGIDIINYLFLPRIVCVIISVTLLSWLFSVISIISGFLLSNLIFDIGLFTYSEIIIKAVNFTDFFIVFIKSAAFGFFITLIPLYYGQKANYEMTAVPISVLNGMVSVFIAIFIIEGLALAARFI